MKQRDGAENRLVKLYNPFYLLLILLFVRQGSGGILSRIPPILLNPDYRIMRSKNIYISYSIYSKGFKISTIYGLDLKVQSFRRPFVNYFILRLGNILDSLPN